MDPVPSYPAEWETHAVLKDGSTVEVRPIQPDDREALVGFHSQQSPESIYFRYFRYRPELSAAELDHLTNVDYRERMAFAAFVGNELIAVARYEGAGGVAKPEVAFFVHDDHQGKGLGTLMLEYLAAAARDRNLEGLTATVLPENYRMLRVFRNAGFAVSTRFADGLIEVELGIDVTPETSSVIADRQRAATARSVARILEARSVAVIGASRQPGTVGHELLRHLVSAGDADGRTGPQVVAVNPMTDEVAGVRSVATIAEAAVEFGRSQDPDSDRDSDSDPDPDSASGVAAADVIDRNVVEGIDLAVVVVRAELVVDVVRQCAEAGVKGLLIVSAGFSELDEAGAAREREVVDLARDHGMRLVGPNAFGILNTDPEVQLRAVIHPVTVASGRVGLASQSGPLGAAVLQRLRDQGVGVSSFVGPGNRADVSVNDLLDYWALDPRTDAVVLYVENFGNLRYFSMAARRTGLTKPIITIRPPAADQAELLHQAGVILVDTVSQLVEQAHLVATQPPAEGNRVAVISNASSLGRLAAAACRREGLELVVPAGVLDGGGEAEDEPGAQHNARQSDGVVLIGDLDSLSLRPSGDPAAYERVVAATAVSEEVDLVLLALVPTAYLKWPALQDMVGRLDRAIDKPMVAVGWIGTDQVQVTGLPVFTFPEEAARVLGRHVRHGRWRAARVRQDHTDHQEGSEAADGEATTVSVPAGSTESPDDDDRQPTSSLTSPPVEELIERVLAGREEAVLTMASPDLPPLLEALDIPMAPWGAAEDLAEAVELADRIGYPVVLKAANLVERSVGESGGAAIDLHDRVSLEAAHGRMTDRLGVAMRTSIVQRMVPSRGAVRLELVQEPAFGALVAIGLGGSTHVGSPPSARRFLPVESDDARALVAQMVADQSLQGMDEATIDALSAAAKVLADGAAASDQIAHISLNPVLLAGSATVATDVEIVLRRRSRGRLSGVRQI